MVLTAHAKERVKERFGINASNAMYRRWVLENKCKIQKGRAGNYCTMLVKVEGKVLLFIMGNNLDAITVVDPVNSYEKWAEEVNYGIRRNA
jgi:hypothetical protein